MKLKHSLIPQIQWLSSKSDSSEPVKKEDDVVLLLARATDAAPNSESRWMVALIEAFFEYKSAGFDKIRIISHDSIKAIFPEHSDFSKFPSENNYFEIAKKFNAKTCRYTKIRAAIAPENHVLLFRDIFSKKQRNPDHY